MSDSKPEGQGSIPCTPANLSERCLSGRKERFAKSSYHVSGTVGSNPTLSAINTDMKIKDVLKLPSINIGDEVLVGKFKNRRATITGFTTDDNNQPVLKTTKGDQKLFKPRIVKLMDAVGGK